MERSQSGRGTGPGLVTERSLVWSRSGALSYHVTEPVCSRSGAWSSHGVGPQLKKISFNISKRGGACLVPAQATEFLNGTGPGLVTEQGLVESQRSLV